MWYGSITEGAFLKTGIDTETQFNEAYTSQNYSFPYPGVRYLVRLHSGNAHERVWFGSLGAYG
jgi:hypothetical protein